MAAAITSTLTDNESSNKTSRTENPYLAARHEWDERYGHLITRERNWRIMAFVCGLTSLLTVAGLIWLSARSRIVPFVVAMDSLGRPIAAGPAEQTTTADDRIKTATLYAWLENLRLVTSDGVAQRKSTIASMRTSRAARKPRRSSASFTEAIRHKSEPRQKRSVSRCSQCSRRVTESSGLRQPATYTELLHKRPDGSLHSQSPSTRRLTKPRRA